MGVFVVIREVWCMGMIMGGLSVVVVGLVVKWNRGMI
jgi:hypothetical protein